MEHLYILHSYAALQPYVANVFTKLYNGLAAEHNVNCQL